jgi:hypothetical protein
MGDNYGRFISEIQPDFYQSKDENTLESLFREYERVIFRSIITAFGLDLFIKDCYGGDVDTIYNVRKVGQDPNLQYKSDANKAAYENRGDYSHKLVEGEGTNFQRIKHEARLRYGENNRNNTVQDAYEDKPLGFLGKSKGHPTDKSAELDHVISAKHIHDDRGRVLAGVSTQELADNEDNLRWTNEHLNKSMGQDEIPDYIAAHPELPEDTKNRMMDAYNQSRASYEAKIERSYYFDFSNPNCRMFYRETAAAAGKRGLQMGIREAVGFLITELWFEVKDNISESDGTALGVVYAISDGSKNWLIRARENYKELFAQFGEGVISGIISSLTSTFLNTFVTTSQSVGRIIRQAWSSIVEATSVLLFNTKEKYFCDRMTSAAKILAAGASMIIGSSVQEAVLLKLDAVAIPTELKNVISIFAGSLCTGMLSVTLLVCIDNDPFGGFLDKYYGRYGEELHKQGELFRRYCAELQNVDYERLNQEAEYIYNLSRILDQAKDNAEMNQALHKAIKYLGIKPLWDGTLDSNMNNKNWVLTF